LEEGNWTHGEVWDEGIVESSPSVGGNKIGVEVALEKDGLYMLGNERMKLGGRGMKIGKLVDKSVSGIRESSDESCRFDIGGPNGTRRTSTRSHHTEFPDPCLA